MNHKIIHLIIIAVFFSTSQASDESSYYEGKELAESLGTPIPTDASIVPDYAGANVPQASLNGDHIKDNVTQETLKKDNTRDIIQDVSTSNTYFKIDPDKDPAFVEANQAIVDPLKYLTQDHETVVEVLGTDLFEEKKCEESRDPLEHVCVQDRVVTVNTPPTATYRITVQVYSHGWSGGLSRNVITGDKYDSSTFNNGGGYSAWTSIQNPFPSNLGTIVSVTHVNPQWYTSFNNNILSVTTSNGGWFWINYYYAYFDVVYQPKPTEKDVVEVIQDGCQFLEENVEKGLCSYESIEITQGPETRVINGYPVTKDWWQKRKTYKCFSPSKNNCGELRAKGCEQINSTCKEFVKDVCVKFEQTYKCSLGKTGGVTKIKGGKAPYCLTGDCTDVGYAPNGDMAEALSKLAIFKEMQKDWNKDLQTIFHGNKHSCRRYCLSFKDCCGQGKGWGVSLNLTGCKKEELALSKLRAAQKCVYVGTYCAEKKPVVGCVKKKSTFCCFESKLSRILHEQGRKQLGISWGSPESPQCRGLTLQELSKINFDQLNLSELFADIYSKYKAPDVQSFSQKFKQDWSQKVPKIQENTKSYVDQLKEVQQKKTSEDKDVVF